MTVIDFEMKVCQVKGVLNRIILIEKTNYMTNMEPKLKICTSCLADAPLMTCRRNPAVVL